MAKITATTTVGFFVFGAGHDSVVGLDDKRAGAGRHARDRSEALILRGHRDVVHRLG
jgi:hypothetical protein